MLQKTVITLFICGCACLTIKAQHKQFCRQIELLNNLVDTHHINLKPLNDSLSAQVWNNFIAALDPNKTYFVKPDLESFQVDKYALDNYFKKSKCKFIKPYIKTLKQRLDESREILESFYTEEFSYSSKDSLYFDSSRKGGYSLDKDDKKEDWLRAMKYETVTEAIKRFDTKESFQKKFDGIKPEVKRFVLDRAICVINEIEQHQNGFDQYVEEIFLNALANVYDPHTIYFNRAEKTAFETTYSSNSLSFGLSTDKDEKGQIIITYVNPNSPAAQEKKITEGDILRSLKTESKNLATTCLSNQEVINFLSNDAHKTIEFEIEKSRGQIKTIVLTKTIIPMEYNAIDALVIDESINAGYLNIPSFYVNSESGDWRGTSLDTGKALYKLFQEDIEGLLIDLRQNGGGSMKEAVDLANLFVDGPMAILKQKDNIITVYNNRKAALFNKPIVIIVDAYTASAAELFAGVMQDYKRAVIVGDNTFGKATSQNIFQLDPEKEDLGFLKITLEKFYRISGKSHQKVGITPDISIHNIFKDIVDREIDYKYVIEADTLQVSEEINSFNLPVEKLKQFSLERQKNNEMFKKIRSSNDRLKYFIKEKKGAYPFLPERVYDDVKTYDDLWNDIYSYFENKNLLSLKLTAYDQNEDENKKNRMESLKTYASGDPIILESYLILKDLIEIKDSKQP